MVIYFIKKRLKVMSFYNEPKNWFIPKLIASFEKRSKIIFILNSICWDNYGFKKNLISTARAALSATVSSI